jgi:4-oxalomesaconate tautomerase
MSDRGAPCLWMRGGTSKGGYFLAEDLPADAAARDAFLLRAMGSPDPRQIDGMGGGDPLTSKVAVVSRSARPGVDVEYLFLQVFVDRPVVSDAQNCGNILAGIGPFAIERGLVAARDGRTEVRILMLNTGKVAVATVATPGGRVDYAGEARIDGVPGSAAPIPIAFEGIEGSTCGALLPTGRAADSVLGVPATLIDNGMPCVVMRAADLGVSGDEAPETLEADAALRRRLEAIRLEAGPLMNLGDVADRSVPKLTLVAAPRRGGTIATRTFIPHRCHSSIGVFGAVSVATACLLPEGPAAALAAVPEGAEKALAIEHPAGAMPIAARVEGGEVRQVAVVRTARRLFDGLVFG